MNMIINPIYIYFFLFVLTFVICVGAIAFALGNTPVCNKISDILFSIFKVVASISFVYTIIILFDAIFTC